MYHFDEGALQQQAERLISDPLERKNIIRLAQHAAEIIDNDGVGNYFDDHDALNLCYHIVGLVKALELKDEREQQRLDPEVQVS